MDRGLKAITRRSRSKPCERHTAGSAECPRPARIWSPCWGVHDVVDGGIWCVVDALSGVCLRRTANPFPVIAALSNVPPLDFERVEDMSTT